MKRKHPERDFHEQVAAYLSKALRLSDGVWWTTFPSGGGGKIRGAQLQKAGLKPGVGDILIVYHGWAHWLELKAKRGSLSDAQKACHADMQVAWQWAKDAPIVFTCKTLADVQSALERIGITPRARIAA